MTSLPADAEVASHLMIMLAKLIAVCPHSRLLRRRVRMNLRFQRRAAGAREPTMQHDIDDGGGQSTTLAIIMLSIYSHLAKNRSKSNMRNYFPEGRAQLGPPFDNPAPFQPTAVLDGGGSDALRAHTS